MLIRPINESDNKSLSVILREVLIEMQIPKKGSAYEDPELDNMFSTYQLPRSKYFVVEERGAILGGAGISPLKGIGDKMIEICIDFAIESGFKKCYIETMPNMLKAQKLYLKKGFKYIDNPLGNTGHNACPVWLIKNII